MPPQGTEEWLDTFVKSINNIPLIPTETKTKIRRNTTFSGQKSMSELANNYVIIIKQSDKVDKTVIMDSKFCLEQIEEKCFTTLNTILRTRSKSTLKNH